MSRNHASGVHGRGPGSASPVVRLVAVLVAVLVATSTFAAAAAAAGAAAPVSSASTVDRTASVDHTASVDAPTDAAAPTATDEPIQSTAALDGNETDSHAVDVVFVFDRSTSMNTERYQLASEMERFQRELVQSGVDARFGLVTYNDRATVRQPFTSNFQDVEDALQFQTAGDREDASNAIMTASEMDFRSDAERVYVLVTDEDDDSTAETRQRALDVLGDATFVAVSPDDPRVSGCDKHSPPCDNSTHNELQRYANDLGGEWVGIDRSASTTMTEVARTVTDSVDVQYSGGDGGDGQAVREVDAGPSVSIVDRSVNRTTVEVGDPVGVNATLENTGMLDGSTDVYVTAYGRVLDRKSVSVERRTERTATLVHRFEEPGEYKLVLNNERVAVVEVTEPVEPTVSVETTPERNRLLAEVSDATTRESVTVDVPSTSLLPVPGAELDRVSVTPAEGVATPRHDVEFAVALERTGGPPADAPELSGGDDAVAYYSVTSTLADDDLGALTFEYANASSNLTMYRYDGESDSWVALRDRTDATNASFAAGTTELSTFAVAMDGPVVSVESADVASTSLDVGESTTATVTVRNHATTTTSYDATVSLDGEIVASESVDVPAGETKTVEVEYEAASAGTYDLAVSGVDQGTLDVAPADTTTTTTGDDASETSTDASTAASTTTTAEGPSPGFTPVVAALALVALAAVAARRR